jgi:hypothetical protein
MTPMAHYLRGLAYGGVVFFGGFFAFAFAAFLPINGEAPVLLRLLARSVVPGELGFIVLFFTAFGLSVAGAEKTRWLFGQLVPADCPQCGGHVYGKGRAPVTYVCRCCGHIHDTGIREGEET